LINGLWCLSMNYRVQIRLCRCQLSCKKLAAFIKRKRKRYTQGFPIALDAWWKADGYCRISPISPLLITWCFTFAESALLTMVPSCEPNHEDCLQNMTVIWNRC